jgi:hypothetical protein
MLSSLDVLSQDIIRFFMESGHQLQRLSRPSPSKFSEFVGTLIAVLTLTLPVLLVAHYSGGPNDSAIAPSLSPSSIIVRQMNGHTKGR